MLTLQDVILLLPEGFYTVSLDLKDGYWHVPIAPAKRPYLEFTYLGSDYWFRALPFGLNIAPQGFHQSGDLCSPRCVESRHFHPCITRRPAKSRSLGIDCQAHLLTVLEIFSAHVWFVNLGESWLTPSQSFQWQGLLWDLALY